jgi:simple sugar transport system permease protein
MPAILATMGSMSVFTGLSIVITEGKAVGGLVPAYSGTINTLILGHIPFPLFMFIACVVLVALVLNKTNYGKKLYMLGTNMKASKFSGINNNRVLMRTYIYSGLLSIVASLIMMGRTDSAKSDVGVSYTLLCVLICVLGGVKTEGGYGRVSGIVIAILILQFISSGLNMFENINNFYRGLIWGVVLVVVLVINCVIGEREKNSLKRRLQQEENSA